MINLEVTVRNGIPPMPITVNIDSISDPSQNQQFSKDLGFTESLNLQPGSYTLIVNGMNPDGGNVEIQLTGNFQSGPLPAAQYTSDTETYTALFYFVI